jgi:ubiquinone/menaquinone biosynthesis C-methylase UbiE
LDKQLEKIRKAYDLTVEQHKQKIDTNQGVPEEIKNTDFYRFLLADGNSQGSGAPDTKNYLNPAPGVKFLDVGCSANLFNYRLDRWPSTYYGVDISPKLVNAMSNFVNRQHLSIGGLYVAEITDMPFNDDFFDIAAVIGVLEYCTMGYIKKALTELNRVLKSGSRIVLDLPNESHPHVKGMAALEEHLERPIIIHSHASFEKILTPLYKVERIDNTNVMKKYILTAQK